MKLFKATTKAGTSEYVDWYEAENMASALKFWDNDREKYGLPKEATVEMIERDPKTHKDIK